MTTASASQTQRSLDELCQNLVAILKTQTGVSQDQREDFLVMLSIQFKLRSSDLGPSGKDMFRRFELRVGAVGHESKQEQLELVAGYFAEHPLPETLVNAVRSCINEFIRSAQPSGVTQAVQKLLAQVESTRPVQGDVRSANSVFQMMMASKS